MNIHVIRTPTDMRSAITDSSRTHFVSVPEGMEPEVRRTTDEIFRDLPYIDSSEPDLLAAYLDGIEEPLARLRAMGFQLTAVTSKGAYQVPALSDEKIPWTNTDFVIAPAPCFFREETDDGLVHVLGAYCPSGHHVFAKEGSVVATWRTTRAVERSFPDGATPWCPTCSEARRDAGSRVRPEPAEPEDVTTPAAARTLADVQPSETARVERERLARVVNHPWVVAIGSGTVLLLASALITYLLH